MRLIDTYVHVRWSDDRDLLPYLDETWHDRWRHGHGHTDPGLRIRPKYFDPDARDLGPIDAIATPGALRRGWLDVHQIESAVLGVHDAPLLSTFGDIDYPIALAEAANRWLADTFLSGDDPALLGGIVVATQDPEAAAREIRRAARNPRVVRVTLPAGTRLPYGHRHYKPIFAAAADLGLAVAIAAGTEGVGTSYPPTPVGWPGTVAEMSITPATNFLCHLTSLVTEGVFAEFPTLRIVACGTGVAWLPPFLWRFDKNYKALRSECPWVRELPSELVCRHFRFTSAGAGPADPVSEFWRLLATLPSPDILMYASGHPRPAAEAPSASFVLSTCPETRREAIAWAEAAATFRPR